MRGRLVVLALCGALATPAVAQTGSLVQLQRGADGVTVLADRSSLIQEQEMRSVRLVTREPGKPDAVSWMRVDCEVPQFQTFDSIEVVNGARRLRNESDWYPIYPSDRVAPVYDAICDL